MTIEELLIKYDVPYKKHGEHHHTTRGRIQTDCPNCSQGSNQFRMGLTRYSANCWGCGGHQIAYTLHQLTGADKDEINAVIYDGKGAADYSFKAEKTKTSGRVALPDPLTKLKSQHKRYLSNRDFDWEEVSHIWKIKGICEHSILDGLVFSWRIFIPIFEGGNAPANLASWTTRSIGKDVRARYISAKPEQEKYHHKDLLYGEWYCNNSIIVVEGPLDVWRIGPGAVCTFGTGYTRAQVLRIAQYPRRTICFDSDIVASRQAAEFGSELEMFSGTTNLITLDKGDPASSSPAVVEKLRAMVD